MTEPKQGDRVRLTTKGGENTVTGVYNYWNPNHHAVTPDGAIESNLFRDLDWNIEVIEPTTLDRVKALKPGAVIHNGKSHSALMVKSQRIQTRHDSGNWHFIYSDGEKPAPLTEQSVANFLDGNTAWEIKYEGHEVT